MIDQKLKIGIFDLTDCEGCELLFISLREKLLSRACDFEITNWRLANDKNEAGPFDVTFIEGSPITKSDIEIIKQARRVSKKIITLGTCAEFGGIQTALPDKNRPKDLSDIYGDKYKASSKAPRPLAYYIDVDVHLPGCPISTSELERLLSSLLANKKFTPKSHAVCLECKANGTPCLFLDEGFCMGPVTRGGCNAICTSKGLRCYGCLGPIKDANLNALKNATKDLSDPQLENNLRMFFANTDVYKEYKTKPKKK